jgi:NADP-dependent 3-hydroxy acid dehydrogenase YdfG
MNIKNHTFIVTGAGSGMGKELSYQIMQKGGFVIGIDRNQETLSQTNEYLREFGGLKASYVLDIANPTAIKTVCEDLLTTHKTIDGIFNNAGIIQPFLPFNELNEQAIRLGRLSLQRQGTKYIEIWEEGEGFKKIHQKLRDI